MNLKGLYLIVRETAGPSAVLLTAAQSDGFREAARIAGDKASAQRDALRLAFGATDIAHCVPCWHGDILEDFALTYDGPHAPAARGLAAAIALGRPWSQGRDLGETDSGGGSRDGGQPAKPRPRAPKGGSPVGGVFAALGAQS